MQNIIPHPHLVPSDLGANPTFNVVIAYGDLSAGKHAKKTYDVLTRNLRDECRFANQMWSFEVLGNAQLREMAVADATQADIIIVSCGAANKLPADVKAWIEQWLDEKTKAIALVALFAAPHEGGGNSGAARDYLADAARRGHMEFFAQPYDRRSPANDAEPTGLVLDARVDLGAAPTLVVMGQQDLSYPRWGINE